ncbi:MAG: biotin/lipoyl-binding protein [Bacteroidales bacterium]|jgi:biotin carboxyl carrier protein|nr:biotin/lipoyl-binding protein [Bacteroidota bacterium]NLN98964.1 biotin/lipoyl-binding protein [Bacteroidales bacterium]
MKEYKFKINGNEYNVTIQSVQGQHADVVVNGMSYQVEMENAPAASAGVPAAASAATPAASPAPPAAAPEAKPAGEGKAVESPLPGVIIEVSVKVGDVVKTGQKVAVIEAMKMENEIQAPEAGTVTAVIVNKGDSVLEGDPIVKIG